MHVLKHIKVLKYTHLHMYIFVKYIFH